MQKYRHTWTPTRMGKKPGIWLALAIALGLHAIILLLPGGGQTPSRKIAGKQIELQLTTFSPQPSVQQGTVQVPAPQQERFEPELSESIIEIQVEVKQVILTASPQARDLEHDIEKMSEQAKRRLTNTILSRQFISEVSGADRLFGRPLEQDSSGPQKEFHYPARQNMIAMLDQPMPEIPFAYSPGLIHFAYDPGIRGDLQRFWDVITPEFGWRTKNGTEFKCIWVLIIAACGWK